MEVGRSVRGAWLAVALLAAACGPKPGSAPRPDPVAVRVTNNNRSDVVVSLLRAGQATRLGTVVSGQTQVLTIRDVPATRLNGLSFEIKRIGAEGLYQTRAVSLGPRQMIVLRVEDLLTTSTVTVSEDAVPGTRMP